MGQTPGSTALLTDHYELTMVQAALRSGIAQRRSAFEVFARKLPEGRRFGIVGGVGRLMDALAGFRFGPDEVEFLRSAKVVDDATCDWLANYRFTGDISAYEEGNAYFPFSPVLTVESGFAEGLVLETLILSILNHDSAVGSAAARMRIAAGDRPLIDGGSRRTHERAAVASARIAHICGFDVTSNLEAARRYGVPSGGTTAHAFVLAHGDEEKAFAAQVESFGPATTFLVDTFDTPTGIAAAVAAAQKAGDYPAAIRIDSGDLREGCSAARRQLDDLGAVNTKIIASGDMDEFSISALDGVPIDRFMVGTQLVVGSGAPTAGFVYKLVARAEANDPSAPLVPVAKRSAFKPNAAGRKYAWREFDESGGMTAEWFDAEAVPAGFAPLQTPLISKGRRLSVPSLEECRQKFVNTLATLPPKALKIEASTPAMTAERFPG